MDEGNCTMPEEVVVTALWPDRVLVARSVPKVVMVELTVPWETRMDEARERKLDRYAGLKVEWNKMGGERRCALLRLGVGGLLDIR